MHAATITKNEAINMKEQRGMGEYRGKMKGRIVTNIII